MAPWIVLTFLVVHLVSLSASVLSYEVVEVQNGGTIAGRVVFVGPIPHLPDLVIARDQEVCGTVAAQMLLVSAESRRQGYRHRSRGHASRQSLNSRQTHAR